MAIFVLFAGSADASIYHHWIGRENDDKWSISENWTGGVPVARYGYYVAAKIGDRIGSDIEIDYNYNYTPDTAIDYLIVTSYVSRYGVSISMEENKSLYAKSGIYLSGGDFYQNSGNVDTRSLVISRGNYLRSANYVIDGGTLNLNYMSVGGEINSSRFPDATFVQRGGDVVVSSSGYTPRFALKERYAAYLLQGGNLKVHSAIINAKFIQTGGHFEAGYMQGGALYLVLSLFRDMTKRNFYL